jgi:hypothetical protein
MRNSKFIRHLEKLDRKSTLEFMDFARSPFFSKKNDLALFIELCSNCILQNDYENLQPELVFYKIYPQKEFKSKKLAELLNYSQNLMNSYLSWISNKKDLAHLQRIDNLDHFELYEESSRELDKRLEKTKSQQEESTNSYWLRFQLLQRRDHHFTRAGRRVQDYSLEQSLEALDQYYFIERIRGACESINRSLILNQTPDLGQADFILSYLEENEDFERGALLELWLAVFEMLRKPAHTIYFERLQDLLQKHDQVAAEELNAIFAFAQNHCIRKSNAGEIVWENYLFELYKQGLKSRVLLQNNLMPQSTYKNIVTVALRQNAYDWTREFIEKYRSSIDEKFRASAYAYNLANYHYSMGDSREAMSLLQSISFPDVFYNLGAKSMLLKIYFEEGEDEALESLCESFRIFLSRNRNLSNQQKESYKNLIGLTRRIHRLRIRSDYLPPSKIKRDRIALEKKINQTQAVMNRKWVLEAFSEI